MSNVWFTSDTHFGHRKVAEIRGFSTVEAHDQALIESWNAWVRKDDVVWHLGDVAMTSSGLATMASLNGRKHLITGNHDAVFPGHRESYRHQPGWFAYFDSIQPYARRKIAGQDVMLSHFPYSGDRGPERHTQYRLRNEGLPLLHGHTHSRLIADPAYPGQFHVGLDAWALRPVSLADIESWVSI